MWRIPVKRKSKPDQRTIQQITLDMLQSPQEWPKWPWLPIKRYQKENTWPECGLVYADGAFKVYRYHYGSTVVEVANFTEYPSPQAIVADGWIVD
jgi:hypothetical protein